ncbi:MAG: FHA domain-containing protein [Xanthomonadales bacterium]|nr:hypothetical protein [Xanthomonadales bacterium]MCC6593937.1 FHA domain-containing protein [Xanthomonadales bacterium]MCE7930507.1 FHA domain-containing protein [Xanthomonadales bacterium PRO6]
MSCVGALELIDRSGHVQQRLRIERLPFRVGRALDNDLVIDDPYVCAHHGEIRAHDGGPLWVDGGSQNGSFIGNQHERRERVALTSGAELRIGHTHLRFRSLDEELPAALPDPLAGSRWLGLDRFGWAAGAVVGSLLAMVSDQVLGSAQALRVGLLLSAVTPALIVLALWALAWSLVNRVVAHRFHYLGHLAIGGLGVVASNLAESIGGYVGFAFTADPWLPAWGSFSGALLVSAVIFGHLRLISRGRARQLLLPAGLVGIVFLALTLLPGVGDPPFSSEPNLSGTLKPPYAALRRGRSAEQYYQDAARVFERADEAAEATAGEP